MAMSLAELTQKLNQNTYTPRTDEQLKTEAENRYKSQYDQMRLTAQQSTETKDQAYQKQLTALQEALQQDQQTLAKSTADSLASANRYQVTRGMQRSSYGAANNARIQTVGQNNLTALLKQFETDKGEVESDRTLLARQLADTLAQYDIDYLNDVQAYIDEQKQIDYEREQEALKNQNDILMALYEYGQAASGGGGGGSRRSSSGGGSSAAKTATTTSSSSLWDSLSGGSSSKTTNPIKTQAYAILDSMGSSSSKKSSTTSKTSSSSSKAKDFAKAMSGLSLSTKK